MPSSSSLVLPIDAFSMFTGCRACCFSILLLDPKLSGRSQPFRFLADLLEDLEEEEEATLREEARAMPSPGSRPIPARRIRLFDFADDAELALEFLLLDDRDAGLGVDDITETSSSPNDFIGEPERLIL